jgi:hypothetical protein
MAGLWAVPAVLLPAESEAERSGRGFGLVGYDVQARDGAIGKVSEASDDVDAGHLVVDTGWWIFGRSSLIPAGAIRDVDHEAASVTVDLTKDEIKDAPEYDPRLGFSAYRDAAEGYYGGLGRF